MRRFTRGHVRSFLVTTSALVTAWLALPVAAMAAEAQTIDPASVERFAGLALACVHQEYPNKIGHVMSSDADVGPPRELTPSFYGCFDWHSCVHGHWLLVRLAKLHPDAAFAAEARTALAASFAPERIAVEVRYLNGEGRASFERPYGLAWLLCLTDELRSWPDEQAQQWAKNVAPLEQASRRPPARVAAEAPLPDPNRRAQPDRIRLRPGPRLGGNRRRHPDDRARFRGRAPVLPRRRLVPAGLRAVGRGLPVAVPRRGRPHAPRSPPSEYATWLGGFLPQIPTTSTAAWLPVGVVTDRADPRLAHIDGLNLSRAWMLEGILAGLPGNDPRRPALKAAADAHRAAGLAAVTGEHYEGGHWLGTFATYLVTAKGR